MKTTSATNNAHQPGQVFQVPTFGIPKNTEGALTSSTRVSDPFLYYSDQERRMAYLTHRNKKTQEKSATSKRCVVAEKRKTRISFEVHPSVIMEDFLLLEMDDADHDDGEDIWHARFGMQEEPREFVTPQKQKASSTSEKLGSRLRRS